MIAAAAVKLGKPCLKNGRQLVLIAAALLLAAADVHPVVLILGGAAAGYGMTRPEEKTAKEGDSP